jgi:hypothetical protein
MASRAAPSVKPWCTIDVSIHLLILTAFVGASVALGLAGRRRASQSLAEYFLAGRREPGWRAGFSMAATQFAADTPLLVTGLIAVKCDACQAEKLVAVSCKRRGFCPSCCPSAPGPAPERVRSGRRPPRRHFQTERQDSDHRTTPLRAGLARMTCATAPLARHHRCVGPRDRPHRLK